MLAPLAQQQILTSEQQSVVNLVHASVNVFFTGAAGGFLNDFVSPSSEKMKFIFYFFLFTPFICRDGKVSSHFSSNSRVATIYHICHCQHGCVQFFKDQIFFVICNVMLMLMLMLQASVL
jgi:hypothetical protein